MLHYEQIYIIIFNNKIKMIVVLWGFIKNIFKLGGLNIYSFNLCGYILIIEDVILN